MTSKDLSKMQEFVAERCGRESKYGVTLENILVALHGLIDWNIYLAADGSDLCIECRGNRGRVTIAWKLLHENNVARHFVGQTDETKRWVAKLLGWREDE